MSTPLPAPTTVREVLARRVLTQQLAGPPAADPVEVVRRLACVQSQEPGPARFSVGMRCGADDAAVAGAYERGDLVRTHVLRPTWHLVLPEDLGWILAATSPRVHARNAGAYRQGGVDEALRRGALTVLVERVATQGPATRTQLAQALAAQGIELAGQHLAHMVMHAELDGLLCSGPSAGTQPTYALLAERAPHPVVPADPEAELVHRFFAGHGPATEADHARWSSSTLGATRAALARLGDRLPRVEVAGQVLWYDPAVPAGGEVDEDRALLLPLFDELTLSYSGLRFPVADAHPYPPGYERSHGVVLVGLRDVGLWRRVLTRTGVRVEALLAPGLGRSVTAAVQRAAERLAVYLGRPLEGVAS